jgi:hypothetical protein
VVGMKFELILTWTELRRGFVSISSYKPSFAVATQRLGTSLARWTNGWFYWSTCLRAT